MSAGDCFGGSSLEEGSVYTICQMHTHMKNNAGNCSRLPRIFNKTTIPRKYVFLPVGALQSKTCISSLWLQNAREDAQEQLCRPPISPCHSILRPELCWGDQLSPLPSPLRHLKTHQVPSVSDGEPPKRAPHPYRGGSVPVGPNLTNKGMHCTLSYHLEQILHQGCAMLGCWTNDHLRMTS